MLSLLLTALGVPLARAQAPGTILTVAGNGAPLERDMDHGSATELPVNYPGGITLDADGNLYVADTWSDRIRKITPDGTMTTVAGNGGCLETEVDPGTFEGMAATEVPLCEPADVAVGADGTVYFTDRALARVFKVGAAGTLTTVAGRDGVGETPDDIGDGGPATQAVLRRPEGIALDAAGNLLFADAAHHRIRKVDPQGKITTVAGNGKPGYSGDGGPATQAQLYSPLNVTTDAAGNLYIADAYHIRKVDPQGIITTVAGATVPAPERRDEEIGDGGPALSAELSMILGVAVDASGALYISDYNHHRVRKVDAHGIITTVAGTGQRGFQGDGGTASAAWLNTPRDVALDGSGNLFVSDEGNHRIRRVGLEGNIASVAGGSPPPVGEGDSAVSVPLGTIGGIAVDPSGRIYLSDSDDCRVRVVSPDGMISTVAGSGPVMLYPSPIGRYSGDGGPALQAQLNSPVGIALGPDGSLFIADMMNDRVRKVGGDGTITTVAGGGDRPIGEGSASRAYIQGPEGVLADAAGNLAIAAAGASLYIFRPDDSLSLPGWRLWWRTPYMAADGAGNFYFVDSYHHRVYRVSSDGTKTTVAGIGEPDDYCPGGCPGGYSGDGGPATQAHLHSPTAVALDAAGNLYISDTGNHAVRRVGVDGIIMTLAGNGTAGYAGDGGPSTEARLDEPTVLALDASGNLYVADQGNHRVREIVNPGGVPGSIVLRPLNGDMNADRRLDVIDVVEILQGIVGVRTLTLDQRSLADTDQDGQLTVSDAVTLLQRIVYGQP